MQKWLGTTERDNHKMPVIYEGEITPEILKKKKKAMDNALKREARLKKIYNERKALVRQ